METDLLIVGGGAAGFGAAHRALQSDPTVRVTLVERFHCLGGTGTVGGVNTWEPGIGGDGVHWLLARRLLDRGDAFVGKTTLFCQGPARPYAVSDRAEEGYEATLHRAGVREEDYRRFQFEPDAMAEEMAALLQEAGGDRLTLLLRSTLLSATANGRRVTCCRVATPQGELTVQARSFIDATGNISLARMVGCQADIGEDPRARHGEAIAPEVGDPEGLNGISLCFRVGAEGLSAAECRRRTEDMAELEAWRQACREGRVICCVNAYPRGGYCFNMLPTVEGGALLRHTPEDLMQLCRARVLCYWGEFAPRHGFDRWRIEEIFPLPGIRESYRLRGRYVLTYEDLLRGGPADLDGGETAAWADHPMDTHGRGGGLSAVAPYRIPRACLQPVEYDNLLVACRGASFSHLAASSARLTRTMMALGEAAGAMAVERKEQG